jgi:hypothetical protein
MRGSNKYWSKVFFILLWFLLYVFCSGDHTFHSKNLYSDKDMVSLNHKVQMCVACITHGKDKKCIQNLS